MRWSGKYVGGLDRVGLRSCKALVRKALAKASRTALALSVAVMAGLLLVVLGLPGVATAQPATWSVSQTPDIASPLYNDLYGVSCTSAASCVAVGEYYNATGSVLTLIETFNGRSWSITSSPNVTGSTYDSLYAVSCASSTSCVAAGYYANAIGTPQTLVEVYNGTAWSITSSPNASGSTSNYLYGVSCTSTSFCVASGYDYVSLLSKWQTLIEAYNGSSWSIVSSPNASGSLSDYLLGVSCTSSTSCVAVGYYLNASGAPQTLIEAYNGSAWSITSSPNVFGSTNDYILGVSCVSVSFCAATGTATVSSASENFVATYNGATWSITPGPVFGRSGELDSISCSKASFCALAGYYRYGTSTNAAVATFDSITGAWSESTVNSPLSTRNELFGVSCVSLSFCVADGSDYVSSVGDQTLIAAYNGSAWSVAASPNMNVAMQNSLLSVSCTSATSCVAVGYYINASSVSQTLIEMYNGAAWSVLSSPNVSGSTGDYLKGVSCASATFCVAVGYYLNASGAPQTLVETYNGATWSITSSPNVSGSVDDDLNGVSCVSAMFCVAAGEYMPSGGATQTLVETYNGASWSITPSANTSGTALNYLNGVSCVSASFCVAAGDWISPPPLLLRHFETLIEIYNGASWSIISSTDPAALKANVLSGVSCTSASFCVAAGYYMNLSGTSQTLVEVYNGKAWSTASNANTSSIQANLLNSVSCATPLSCVASGGYTNASSVSQTLVEAYNGKAWSITPSPNVAGSTGDFLNGVSCNASTSCVAAGYYNDASGMLQTLAEIGVAPTPPPAPVGYRFVASDGGIFSFNAPFYGSMGGKHLNAPIVGMASTPNGGGYWFVASDGGIFSFGNAKFYGSMGGKHLNAPIVGMAADPATGGYWFVASDGGIFSFNAPFLGSMGGKPLNKPIVGMASTPNGGGYWFVASDGGIFSFGNAKFYGSMGGRPLNKPIVGMASDPATGGYWFVASDGGIFSFNAPFLGSMGGKPLNKPIVGMAAS